MRTTNIHQAKTHLSRLVERAAAGEEIVIAKAGKPMAKLVRYEPEPVVERKPGLWRGRVRIAEDFDHLPEEIAAAFRGEQA
jgi:prevent-host-death family protein